MGVFKEREVSFIHAWIKDTNIQKHLYLLLIINTLIKAACLPRNIVNSCNLRLFDVAKQHSNYAHLHRTCTDTGELLSTFKSSSSNQNFKPEQCFIKSIAHLPKVAVPFPVLSKSWKATMKRASGAHSTDSKARNSWKEINLMETNRLTAYILWTLHSTSLALHYWMMRGYHSLITASRRQTKKGSTYFHCEHLTLEWFVQL